MRMIICGGPRTGKTTFARQLQKDLAAGELRNVYQGDVPIRHTDSLIPTHKWSDASDQIADWINQDGPWIIEGVAAVRGIRKWLKRNPDPGFGIDNITFLTKPFVHLTPGQLSMLKGCETIWREIYPRVKNIAVQLRPKAGGFEPVELLIPERI